MLPPGLPPHGAHAKPTGSARASPPDTARGRDAAGRRGTLLNTPPVNLSTFAHRHNEISLAIKTLELMFSFKASKCFQIKPHKDISCPAFVFECCISRSRGDAPMPVLFRLASAVTRSSLCVCCRGNVSSNNDPRLHRRCPGSLLWSRRDLACEHVSHVSK